MRSELQYLLRIILFLFLGNSLHAQDNSARLTIMSGGNVPFAFDAWSKFQSGVAYTNWTLLGIDVTDLPPHPDLTANFTSWDLNFYATSAVIQGDAPANTLDLRTLRVKASKGPLCCAGSAGGLPTAFIPLSVVSQALVLSAKPLPAASSANQVYISYDCGVNPGFSLINAVPDFYTVTIVFDLEPDF